MSTLAPVESHCGHTTQAHVTLMHEHMTQSVTQAIDKSVRGAKHVTGHSVATVTVCTSMKGAHALHMDRPATSTVQKPLLNCV